MVQAMETINSVITHKDKQGIGRITINRPEAYNALSLACMRSLIGAFKLLSADDGVRVIVLDGAGKGFCAGHDLAEMRSGRPPKRPYSRYHSLWNRTNKSG